MRVYKTMEGAHQSIHNTTLSKNKKQNQPIFVILAFLSESEKMRGIGMGWVGDGTVCIRRIRRN